MFVLYFSENVDYDALNFAVVIIGQDPYHGAKYTESMTIVIV